jgi:hypothetical protein
MHPTEWNFRHRRDGRIIWASGLGDLDVPASGPEFDALVREQPWQQNELANEGESDMLDVYFRNATVPTGFYIGLLNSTPIDTTTLATMTGEPATGGYARKAVARSTAGWPTLALDAGDFRADSAAVTFTASGGTIGPVIYVFLCTNAATGTSGKFVAYTRLSGSRTLFTGESMDVFARVKLM